MCSKNHLHLNNFYCGTSNFFRASLPMVGVIRHASISNPFFAVSIVIKEDFETFLLAVM